VQLKKLFSLVKLSHLETIEEKSFWAVAMIVATVGLLSLTTAGSYNSALPTIFAGFFCLLVPVLLMYLVYKYKNYHVAYPLLCISTGAIAIPVAFIFCGGFLSCMPLYCVVTTGLTALCYSTKWRFSACVSCLAANTVAFYYVYKNGSPFPLKGTEPLFSNKAAVHPVYNDTILGYFFASLALYIAIQFVVNDIRRYKLNQDALQRFFDKEKRKEILRQVIDEKAAIGSEHKKAVIVFADISNFTTITENMPDEKIAGFLNEFFTEASNAIHSTGGIIDKFIGDCVMAYWLDDGSGNCVLGAVQAMLKLRFDLLKKSEIIYDTYATELNFSAGIAYGNVIFGDIGSDTMHDFTVIGDAVNTASRLESFAIGGEMLISDAAAKMVKGMVILDNVETEHFFKGKNKPVDLYRIVGFAASKTNVEIPEHDVAGYTVHVCGCRGSFPVSGLRFTEYGGETSSYVVRRNDYAVIVDCGTGLKNAVNILEGCKKIDILLTHVHYDHILGLLMSKFPLDAKIRIFGHFSVWNRDENILDTFMQHPYWPVEIVNSETHNVDLAQDLTLEDGVTAAFYSSDHPDNGCVIKLTCGTKKVVFLFDCENAAQLPDDISRGAELLFFDGMFDDNDTVDHTGWGHGTWQDGVRFAVEKEIKKLVVTHHNPELGDHSLMQREIQARNQCANVSFAKSGDTFVV